MRVFPILAVIPARGGSKGLPQKNIRLLGGLPLIAHSIQLAAMCPEIDRCIVSTDDQDIAATARHFGGEVPFMRPPELARDDTPSWQVLQHALREMEALSNKHFESLLLLQPTNPGRLPEDISAAVRLLEEDNNAVGVVSVAEPPFNLRWLSVEERGGYLASLFDGATKYTRRQEVPPAYHICGAFYLWRRSFVLETPSLDLSRSPHRMVVIPNDRAIDIDHLADLQMAELLLREGLLHFPWLKSSGLDARSGD